jgi:dynein heavy chain
VKTGIGIVNFEPGFGVKVNGSPSKYASIKDSSIIAAPTSLVQHPTGFSVGGGKIMNQVDPAEKEDGVIEPKVFVPYERTANLPPRQVEVER